jgi:hypothetical protein
MTLPPELERAAFRCANGEYAWRPQDVPRAVKHLAESGVAILGGELWMVIEDAIYPIIPAVTGPPIVWTWSCDRQPDEPWLNYVARSAEAARDATRDFSLEGIKQPRGADFYFNLTWASEAWIKEWVKRLRHPRTPRH